MDKSELLRRKAELERELAKIEAEEKRKEWGLCLDCKYFKPHQTQEAYKCDKHRTTGGDSYYTTFEPRCREWPSVKKLPSLFEE